jgi:hypothetical protein
MVLRYAALFLCAVATLEASPIHWTLSNVNFSDGSSVTGYFVFDADLGSPPTGLTDFRLSVSGGSLLPDFVYEPSNPLSQLLIYSFPSTDGPQEVINAFRGRSPSGTAFELLYLDPVSFLTNAGGTVPLNLVKSSAQLSDGEMTYASSVLTSGSLIGVSEAPVPEPASFLMVLIGGSLLAIRKIRCNVSSHLAKFPLPRAHH